MSAQITIRTRIHESIYKGQGGGQTHTYFSWVLGPRNLMKAIEMLPEHSRDMTNGYGNVGHCGSWIEVAGVRMTEDDVSTYEWETDQTNFDQFTKAVTKTEWCRRFIANALAAKK